MEWFNEIVEHVGMWVIVLVGLLLVWWIGGIPVAVKSWLEKKGKKVPALLEDHIVLVEIVWIALLVFLGYRYSPI